MALTIGRHVDVALAGDEVVALALAVVLGPELLGAHLSHRLASVRDLSLSGVVGLHRIYDNSIIESGQVDIENPDASSEYRQVIIGRRYRIFDNNLIELRTKCSRR